jgi:hypothetical protein
MRRILLVAILSVSAAPAQISVKDYGAKGDGVTDDTKAIQSAVDACEPRSPWITPGEVRVPGGWYRISATLNWKRCAIVGVWPHQSEIFWDGPPGGTVIEHDMGLDNAGYTQLSGIGLRAGSARPAHFLRISGAGYIDKFTSLRDLEFHGSSSDAVVLDGRFIANLHFEDLRFDGIDGYGMRVNIMGPSNGNSFTLDRFTYDNAGTGAGGGKGLIAFDNQSDTVFALLARIANGRIETNLPLAGDRALISFLNAGGKRCSFMSLELNNVYYQNVTGTPGQFPFYHDKRCGGGTGTTPIMLHNVVFEGIDGLFTGLNYNWNSVHSTARTQRYANTFLGNGWIQEHGGENQFVGYDPADRAISVRGRQDTGPRFSIAANGGLCWNSAKAELCDAEISRTAAGLQVSVRGDRGSAAEFTETGLVVGSARFAGLGAAPLASRVIWCADCAVNDAPPHTCGPGGSGAWAFYNSAAATWRCPF